MFRTRDYLSLRSPLSVQALMAELEQAFAGPVHRANYRVDTIGNEFHLQCRGVSGDLSTPLRVLGKVLPDRQGSRVDFHFDLALARAHHLFLIIWGLMLLLMLSGGMIHWLARDIGGGNRLVGVLGASVFLIVPYQLTYGSIPLMKGKMRRIVKRSNRKHAPLGQGSG